MSIVNIMAGRLTGDPESKPTKNGGSMVNFSLADNHGKDDQGKDKVTFYRCTAFGKQGEMILASCKKAHRLNVVGRLETREYTNNAGQPATSLDVTVSEFGFIEPRQEQPAQAAPAPQAPAPAAQHYQQPYPPQQPAGYPPQQYQQSQYPAQAPAPQQYAQQPYQQVAPQGYPQQQPQGYPPAGYPQQQPAPPQGGYAPQQQQLPMGTGGGRSPF